MTLLVLNQETIIDYYFKINNNKMIGYDKLFKF
jgi:hypothetical protein